MSAVPEADCRQYLETELEADLSPFGLTVAAMLDDIWGLHNLRRFSTLRTAEWGHQTSIRIGLSAALATFDGNQLTQLVVRGHDACVRVEVSPLNARMLRLTFSARDRVGARHEQHPRLEAAIEAIRRAGYYGPGTSLTPMGG